MERDFKQEFIELKQNETPDLWKRIEAGISERKALEYIPEKAVLSGSGYASGKAYTDEKAIAPRKIIPWRRWGTLVAACLCAAVIIPAVSLIMRNKGYNYSGSASDSSPADNSADGAAMNNTTPDYAKPESAAPQEGMAGGMDTDAALADAGAMNGGNGGGIQTDAAADRSSMSGVQSAVAEDIGSMDGAQSDAGMNDGIVENGSAVQESDDAGGIAETEKMKDLSESKEYISGLGLENGQVIENIIIQIVRADESGEEVIYQAIVLSPDTDVILEKNMQIEIVCNTDTEYASSSVTKEGMMEDGEKYEVSLRFEQDRLIVTNVAKVK